MKLIKDIIGKRVISLKEGSSVKEICKILTRTGVSGLPVIDESKKLIGFVSERDVIAAVSKVNFLKLTAKNLMTKKVTTLLKTDPVTRASQVFSEKPYRRLPVVDAKGKLVGVICRNDVISQMLGYYY